MLSCKKSPRVCFSMRSEYWNGIRGRKPICIVGSAAERFLSTSRRRKKININPVRSIRRDVTKHYHPLREKNEFFPASYLI